MNNSENYLTNPSLDVANLNHWGYVLRPVEAFGHVELPPCCVLVPPVKEGPIVIVQRREQYITKKLICFAIIYYYIYGEPEHDAIHKSEQAFQEAMKVSHASQGIVESTSVYMNHVVLPSGVDPVSHFKASN